MFEKGSLIQLNIGELSNSKAITSLFGSTNLYQQFHTSNWRKKNENKQFVALHFNDWGHNIEEKKEQ